MKPQRFLDKQIIDVPKEAEAGAKTGNLARQHEYSDATIYIYGRLPDPRDLIFVSGEPGCQYLSDIIKDAGAPKRIIRAA